VNNGAQAERPDVAPLSNERPLVFLMTNTLETGGSERQFITLARALDREKFGVELGCVKRKGALLEELEEISEFKLGGSLYGWHSLRARMALLRHLRAHAVAVAHSFDFYTNLVLIPVARLSGVSAVIGSHRQIGDLLSPLQFAVQSAVFRLCDRVVCNSVAAEERLRDAGISEHKLVLISNALPADAFAEASPALPRLPGVLRVGMIARMNSPVKNHPLFLRAAARLATAFPNLEFVLVGDGPLRPSLQKLAAQLGLGGRVKFLGERHDIPAVFAALDVSVVPSSSESLSNAVLESMAAGVPVVATRVGGTPEVVSDGETGLLVPPDDEERLAAAITAFLTRPELRVKCRKQGRELARANFAQDKVCKQFERLYQSVLAEKGRESRSVPFSANPASPPRPLRVTIVAASPRWIGGHSVQAGSLLRRWRDDPAVDARLVPIDPQLPRGLAWAERIPLLRTTLRSPFFWRELWRGVRDADVVHIFSASYWSFLVAPVPAWLIARLRGKRVLINYHSGEARDHLRNWRTALPVLRRVDRLVVPSAYLAQVFREFGLEARVVPNMVDLREFSYRPRRPLRPFLISTRGFHPYYSVDLVVRAFAEVKKEFPAARLWLVGKGETEGTIRRLVTDLRVADVEFTGPVPHERVARFYDAADIFINASWVDNLPISLLEAFASGTPVVTTAPEGIRYMVEDGRTGLLCEPGDWRALANHVIRLLHDPDLARRLAANACEEVQRYRWETVRAQWLDAYQSTLEDPATAQGRKGGSGSVLAPPRFQASELGAREPTAGKLAVFK